MASLSSENPYATIRDLPSLLGGPRESSYMEMKGPPSGSALRQPPQLRDSQRLPRDSGTYEQPSPLTHGEPSTGAGAGENWDREVGRGGDRESFGGSMMWQQELSGTQKSGEQGG